VLTLIIRDHGDRDIDRLEKRSKETLSEAEG
jgi:hypothetical protein